MKCNLVKKTVKVHSESEGKDLRFTNYYLVFENGDLLPVVCKKYITSSKDKKDLEKINNLNTTNFIKFQTLADLLKDDESK